MWHTYLSCKIGYFGGGRLDARNRETVLLVWPQSTEESLLEVWIVVPYGTVRLDVFFTLKFG